MVSRELLCVQDVLSNFHYVKLEKTSWTHSISILQDQTNLLLFYEGRNHRNENYNTILDRISNLLLPEELIIIKCNSHVLTLNCQSNIYMRKKSYIMQ